MACRFANFRRIWSVIATSTEIRVVSNGGFPRPNCFYRQLSSETGSSSSGPTSGNSGASGSVKGENETEKKTLSGADSRKQKKLGGAIAKDVIQAVGNVAVGLHTDPELRKKTMKDLTEQLVSFEQESFKNATEEQMKELLADKGVVKLLSTVANQKPTRASRAAEVRHARRGLLLLRREIFYQAKQSGYSAVHAHRIAEQAVASAEARAKLWHQKSSARLPSAKDAELASAEISKKEQSFYDYAYRMAETMLHRDGLSVSDGTTKRRCIEPDSNMPSLFSADGPRLGIFTVSENLCERSLQFWNKFESDAATIANKSFGPSNAFEEMIELTEQGKMWPYPIDNEYLLGEEEHIAFYEHVFTERMLEKYGLPRSGVIAHFMELVCVGLSKNPYMTLKKKKENVEWFANYFSEQKVEDVNRLHEREQLAASSA